MWKWVFLWWGEINLGNPNISFEIPPLRERLSVTQKHFHYFGLLKLLPTSFVPTSSCTDTIIQYLSHLRLYCAAFSHPIYGNERCRACSCIVSKVPPSRIVMTQCLSLLSAPLSVSTLPGLNMRNLLHYTAPQMGCIVESTPRFMLCDMATMMAYGGSH